MSYSMEELSRETGIPARTVRYYIQIGLITAPTPRGRHTRYEDNTLARLKAIQDLRKADVPLDEIRQRIAASSEGDLGATAGAPLAKTARPRTPPRVREALSPQGKEDGSSEVRAPSVARSRPSPLAQHSAGAQPPGDRWARTVLVPGLEIHVREDAGPLVDRLAREIIAAYGLPRMT